ncbi:MAG: alcohol dehydrogenase catalytic domain-containing protein [Alphaproteobacteria bacterium]
MRALVYTGTQLSEIRDVPTPVCDREQVVVDLAFCGICGSDMHAWHGHDERRVPPLVLGHEAVGVANDGPLRGQRVAINPLMACGACVSCLSGNEHLCAKRELIGMRVPGAFAEKVAIKAQNLTILPDDLSFVEAALAEPLACSVHAVRLALQHADDDRAATIAILGGGAIGLLAGKVFLAYGYHNIWIAEPNSLRRSMLEKLGNFNAYDPTKSNQCPQNVDMIIDAVGSGTTRRTASAMVRPGGVIVHIGLQDNVDGLDARRITLQEITFKGTYCYRNDDFAEALRLLHDGAVSGSGWVDVRPLTDGAKAFQDIHNGTAPPKIILDIS